MLYLFLFSAQFIALSAFITWYEIAVNTADGWPQTIIAIGNGISPWVIVIVADSALLTEATMLVSQYLIEKYRNKRHREGRAEGRAEGREEERQQWVAWNRRRMEAEAANRPFTEPPPDQQPADRNRGRMDA